MTTKPIAAGSIFIKHSLPTKAARDAFDTSRILDKKGMSELINLLILHGGDKAYETINTLARMFFDKSTEIEATTPLSDYDNSSQEREAMIGEFEQKVKEIIQSKLNPKDKTKKLDELASETRKRLNTQNLKYLLSRGSVAAKMSASGARGNPEQLGLATASPLMAYDLRSNPIPVAIKSSFAEGLTPAETIAMSYGGRMSTVLSNLATEKPGALFKRLGPSLFHEVVTIADCKTKNGILYPSTDSKAIVGRFEAGTNHFIDENYYNQIKKSKEIKVRSPLTCEAHEGVCQKCMGMQANAKLPDIGHNVGVIAAQSVSEVLTQAMLSTKHTGGVSGGQRNIYEEANNLLSNPRDNFQDESTVSTINGTVTKITQTPLKDWEVYIDTKAHFVSREQEPVVEVGEKVHIGDPLSTGTINPRKLTELKGAGAGRMYLANKLREVYSKKASGLDPRHFELISKNMIKYYEVRHPGESEFLPGQIVDVQNLHKYLGENHHSLPVDRAADHTLAKGVLELTPGTHLTDNHIRELKDRGIKTVDVSESKMHLIPIVPGLQTVKLADHNWVSKLSFSRLAQTLQDAPALKQQSSVHDIDPVTPYMLGHEFGEGKGGKY
jgi:DNA-directed RNA polymerase subunit beta'